MQIIGDEAIANQSHAFELIGRLRNDLARICRQRLRSIDGNDSPKRGFQVGQKKENGPVIIDEMPGGIAIGQQLDHPRIRCSKIFVKDAIVRISPFADGDNKVMAIISYFAIEEPFLLVWSLISERVRRLRGTELVKEQFLIVNLRSEQ